MQKTITIQETKGEFYFFNFISNVKFVFCFCFIVCCRSSQFSSDFPEELIGIIRPDEFQNSINNINRARQKTLCEIILSCALSLSLLLGFFNIYCWIFNNMASKYYNMDCITIRWNRNDYSSYYSNLYMFYMSLENRFTCCSPDDIGN